MVKLSMYRKSVVDGQRPFRVDGFQEYKSYIFNVNIPHINVSSNEYNRIAKTLDSIPPHILKQMVKLHTRSEWGHIIGGIITDGKRQLLVDTQGSDYPRYKGVIEGRPYR